MKVAPAEKKAKLLSSKLMKPKTRKAGDAVTKKKKGTLLKGFTEASLSSENAVLKTTKGQKSTPAKDSATTKKSLLKRKSLNVPFVGVKPNASLTETFGTTKSGKKLLLKRKLLSESEASSLAKVAKQNKGKAGGKNESTKKEKTTNSTPEKTTSSPSKKKAHKKNQVVPKQVSKVPQLEDLKEAADAVLKVIAKKQTGLSKKHLFAGNAQPIYLQLHSVRVPKTAPRVVRFNVPHSIHEDNADICLILADPIKGRKRDTEQDVIVEDYREMLENKGVKNIKEVIPFSYLRAQYSQYGMKTRFANLYDVVLCDARFVPHAGHFLGKDFFSRRCLTPVRLTARKKGWVDDFKSAIDFALHKTWLRVHPTGTSFNVIVGHTRQTSEEIAANVLVIFNDLQSVFPGGLDNIRTAVLKGHESLPVPIFASRKSPGEVAVPFVKPPHDKRDEPATGELSTKPGRVVTVYPGGRIDLRNKMTPEDEEYEKLMGQESKWKKNQRKLKAQQEKEGTEDKPAGKQNKTANFPKKAKLGKGKKPFQDKKLSQKKTLSQGKKVFPGKKFPPGISTNAGKKPAHGKKTTKQRKAPQKS